MIGEELIGVIVIVEETPEWWPIEACGEALFTSEYFVTDRGVYHYEGASVAGRRDNAPEGSFVPNITPAYGQIIKDVRNTDDLSNMILFDSGDVFFLGQCDPKLGIYLTFRWASEIDLTDEYYSHYYTPTLIK